MATYTIKSGDTLSAIAARNGTTVAALAAANGISNPNAIRAGATLTIPASATTAKPAAAPAAASVSSPGSYKGVAITPGTQAQIQAQMAAIDKGSAGGSVAGASTTKPASGITITPTGDPQLDQVLQGVKGVADNLVTNGYTIPSNLQITPDLMSAFLGFAHQAVDPYTKQLLDSRVADVNSNLKALATDFTNSTGEREQQFGTDLATEQNTAGAAGTAFSGQRNVNELNLAGTANRDLSTLAANAGYNIGSAARAAASDVGKNNASAITLPSLAGGSVSLSGGQRGSTGTTGALSYDYDPSIYGVGTIPSNATQNVNQLEQSYIGQYGTIAGNQSNSGRSVGDLIGMISGLPSGYKVPSNLT